MYDGTEGAVLGVFRRRDLLGEMIAESERRRKVYVGE